MSRYSENEQRIIKTLGFLAMLYPRFELSEATIAAYVTILADLPAELVEAAAKDLGSRSKWFPAAAELREAAFELVEERQSGLPTAYEAWAEVVGEIRRVGTWREPAFSHDLIARSVEAVGGWRLLCLGDNPAADRARFVAAYETYVQREQRASRLLPGVTDLAFGPGGTETEAKLRKQTGAERVRLKPE